MYRIPQTGGHGMHGSAQLMMESRQQRPCWSPHARSKLLCKALATSHPTCSCMPHAFLSSTNIIPVYIFVGAWLPAGRAYPQPQGQDTRRSNKMLDQAVNYMQLRTHAACYSVRCHARTFDHYNWMAIIIYHFYHAPFE
jgi:hypothetical protein